MNQDEIKAALVALRPTKADFTLIFSGKSNKRVNGLYKPASREIVIHNRNFTSENDLFFTALHEYAHHIMTSEKGASTTRAHTLAFWATLHELVGLAEAAGLYRNPARGEAFAPTTKKLEGLIAESGRIMREIGTALLEAQGLCQEQGARFDDYVMRILKQTMPWARACMAAAGYDLPADLGAENLKTVAAIKNEDERAAMVSALEGDLSPQQVKAAKASANDPEDAVERLEKEKVRLARTISNLVSRLYEAEKALQEAGAS